MQAILQHYQTFIAVVECLSFTRASKKLGLSKGAVSQAIKQLEAMLKVDLLLRTTRKLSLTEEGQQVYQQCLRLDREVATTLELAGQFQDAPQGHLRICCNPQLAKARLPALLDDYMRAYPDVTLDILCDERMPDLHAEQIDIVFGISWPAPDDVVAKVIGHTRYVLCASPEYLAKHGTPETIEELTGHAYFPHLGRDPATPLMHFPPKAGQRLSKRIAVNSISLLKAFAMSGLGLVQVHDYVIEKSLASGRLVEVLPKFSQPDVPLYVYYAKQRFVQPKISAFIKRVAHFF